MFCIKFGLVNYFVFLATQPLLRPHFIVLRFGDLALYSQQHEQLHKPAWDKGSGEISELTSTMWEESRMTKERCANESLVFMNAPNQKDPKWRLWVQSFDPAHRHRWVLRNTWQTVQKADGDEIKWYQLTHSEHSCWKLALHTLKFKPIYSLSL